MLFVTVYADKLKAIVKREDQIGVQLQNLYTWVEVVEQLSKIDNPQHKTEKMTIEYAKKCQMIKQDFDPYLSKETGTRKDKWLTSAVINAQIIFDDCKKEFSKKIQNNLSMIQSQSPSGSKA